MKPFIYLTLALINLIALSSLNAQDCPPINFMKSGSCIIVEYATAAEANTAYAAPAEIVTISESAGNDGVYIAQMMADGNKVIFSQAGTCGYYNYEGAVEGTFTFLHSGLSCTYGATGSILPVEFSYFAVEKRNNHVLLNWGTATEIENDGFSIERSTDGKKYEELGFVVGEGYSDSEIKYAFTDRAPTSGKNYYRLKQIDFNGKFSYSDIKVVELKSDARIKINYDLGSENIIFVADEELSKIEIFDMSGNKLIEQNEDYAIGENRVSVQTLVAGNYVLIATGKKGTISTNRFIKI